uniref:Tail component n=1 Tax=Myoviridae sp. ctdyF5 TaxID=2825144 RepID=A0A8S5U7J7_9CAUD|nr:MAG TPA: tail component [Myoviridae sp. ctdyF5]
MTEDTLYSLLSSLAGGQVYPYVAPLNENGSPSISPPWVVFSLPSEVSEDTLCGQAETSVTIQVDVYATRVKEARALLAQALENLSTLGLENISKFPGYEPETQLHRATFEASVIV